MSDLLSDFAALPDELIAQFELLHRQELEKRKFQNPHEYFPWHKIQTWVFEAPGLIEKPVRILLVAGGNRGGKSATGKGLWSQVIRRESPINRQLTCLDMNTGEVRRKGDLDPLNVWVVPPTLEKARQDWITPSDGFGLKYWAGNNFLKHEEQPDNVIYTRTPGIDPWIDEESGKLDKGKCDKTIMKSQDQALHTFESSAVDLALVDEELQDVAKWNSVLLRLATTNGMLGMFYTPLNGLTWSYERYWKPLVKLGRAEMLAERCWVHSPSSGATVVCAQMGCADNPLARNYAEEIEADPEMTTAEKGARLHGEYGFVEGTLLPALAGFDVQTPEGEHRHYVVDALPGMRKLDGNRVPGKIERWLLVTDPNKSYGGLLGCQDGDGNLFFVAEHLQESWPNRRHAEAFREMERRYATGPVQRYADPGSAGAQSMVDMNDLGMMFSPMPKGAGSVGASIKRLRGMTYVDPKHAHPITGRLGAPRVYFYRPGMVSEWEEKGRQMRGCRTAEQIAQVRQTANRNAPPDTPHKDIRSKLDLFDCARYMAHLASEVTNNDQGERRRNSNPDRLPGDEVLTPSLQPTTVSPLDTQFWLPEYSFGGGYEG